MTTYDLAGRLPQRSGSLPRPAFRPPSATTMTMPRRPKGQSRAREKSSSLRERRFRSGTNKLLGGGRKPLVLAALGGIASLLLLIMIGWLATDSPARLTSQAEAAARAGDWTTA